LLSVFIKKEFEAKYRGSLLGFFWLILNPIVMLLIYILVFHRVLNVKWSAHDATDAEFALYVYIGILVFNFFSESVQIAPGLIVQYRNLVKKVAFPLEILPWIPIAISTIDVIVGGFVWLFFCFFVKGGFSLTFLLIPVVFLPFFLFVISCVWLVSSIGVYIKDISYIVRFLISGLLFLSPVFFPLSAAPVALKSFLMFNPLAIEIEMLRQIMLLDTIPDINCYMFFLIFACFFYLFSFVIFIKIKDGFADVL